MDVVVQVLRDPSKRGGTHLLTRREAISWTDVARAMSSITGRATGRHHITRSTMNTVILTNGPALQAPVAEFPRREARQVGIKRSTLYSRMQKRGILRASE